MYKKQNSNLALILTVIYICKSITFQRQNQWLATQAIIFHNDIQILSRQKTKQNILIEFIIELMSHMRG